MQKSLIFIFVIFILKGLNAQKVDTINLPPNHVLVTFDTIFFGNSTDKVILPDSTKYFITKSFKRGVDLFESYYRSLYKSDPKLRVFKAKEAFEKSVNDYLPYKGKIIRSISIKQVDLLEGNVSDTILVKKIQRTIINGRFNSHKWVIKQNIRIKKYDVLVPEIISDNERVIRNLPYIDDAKIYVNIDSVYVDSVDVVVVTRDKFPVGFTGSVSSLNQFTLQPYNKNFLGTGHTFQPEVYYDALYLNPIGYGGKYVVPNIARTFIKTKFEFENSYLKEQYKISVTKPFITNDVLIGGGVSYYRLAAIKKGYYYYPKYVISTKNNYSKDYYDIWLGKSFKLNKHNYTSFVNISGRFYSEKYVSRPIVTADTNRIFHDNNVFLARISLINSQHYETSRLYGYGVTEDVPYGYSIDIQFGLQSSEYIKRPYVGSNLSFSQSFNKVGYFSFKFSVGSFLNNNALDDLKAGGKLTYFSPYKKYGKIGIRHSIIPVLSTIYNPKYIDSENFGSKIRQLNQETIYGKSIMICKYEPYIYSHYSIKKFKMAFSLFADVGWISKRSFWKSTMDNYGAYGLGFHLKNERLTIPTFTVQLAYYAHWEFIDRQFNGLVRFSDRKLFDEDILDKPELYHSF